MSSNCDSLMDVGEYISAYWRSSFWYSHRHASDVGVSRCKDISERRELYCQKFIAICDCFAWVWVKFIYGFQSGWAVFVGYSFYLISGVFNGLAGWAIVET